MKNNWQTKKLGEILEKTETIDPTKKPNTEFSYVDVSSVSNQTFSVENVNTLKGKNAPSRARKLIRRGDIIFATVRPTLQRIAIIPESLDGQICSTGYFVMRPAKEVSRSFLFHFLFSDYFTKRMQKLQKGASYPAVTDTDVKNSIISFPESLTEQERIANILDKAFEKIDKVKENVEKNLQNSKELFESYLQSVFANQGKDWEEKTLSEILEIERGGSPRPIQKYFTKSPDGINWIKIGDTKDSDKYITATAQKIKPEGLKKSRLVHLGDFLLSNSMSFGRPYILKISGAIHDGWLVLREKDKSLIDKDYLYNILGSSYVFNQFDRLAAGSTVRNLNINLVSGVKIPVPKIEEQKTIVKKLDAMYAQTKKLEANYRRKIADLEELKKSLLTKAFAGEL